MASPIGHVIVTPRDGLCLVSRVQHVEARRQGTSDQLAFASKFQGQHRISYPLFIPTTQMMSVSPHISYV